MTALLTRRSLTVGLAAFPAGLGLTSRVGAAIEPDAATTGKGDGLTHTSETIHQEVLFKAPRRRVYRLLTNTAEFDAVTRLSDAVTLLSAPGAKPTVISERVGGSFTLFGGYIAGRHLEMVPNERLVQAWRAGGWPTGDYSIVKFALHDEGDACRLVFDHRGFPEGQGSSLAYGWHTHYWDAMMKRLAQG